MGLPLKMKSMSFFAAAVQMPVKYSWNSDSRGLNTLR